MGTRMKKADVERRYERGDYLPTINVKWYPYLPEIVKKFKGTKAKGRHGIYTVHEFGDGELFWAWVERLMADPQDAASAYPNGEFTIADEIARESGWETAQEDADTVWESTRYQPKIESSGRSSGWLIVNGLPDIDDWDATDLARWARYVKWVKATVEDLDYQFVWHLHVNVYENAPDYNPDAGFQLTLEDA